MVAVNHPTFLTLFKESEITCAQHSQVLLTYNQITKYKGARAITGAELRKHLAISRTKYGTSDIHFVYQIGYI
jgi:hypothetical protein